MSIYIVTIDNYAGQGYLPDIEPAGFDSAMSAADYIVDEIGYTLDAKEWPWSEIEYVPTAADVIRALTFRQVFDYTVGGVRHTVVAAKK